MSQKTILGHPVGLYVLFFTETWERFSYYGMRTLLILYMTKHLLIDPQLSSNVIGLGMMKSVLESIFGPLGPQPLASQIYGLYTAFVYLTPLAGGWISDRLLGQRKTIIIGSLIMALGHFLMAIEPFFLIALFALIIGNGFFKPNISTQVGGLYAEGDERKDSAYTIFYMGVNVGAFLSPLVCGTLGQVYGWHYGFGAAGIGMLVGLCVYIFGAGYLPKQSINDRTAEKPINLQKEPLTKQQKSAIWALIVLLIPNMIFWAIYEQQGNAMQIFADSRTDWHIFGWEMPSTWLQAFNPFFIFTLAPLLNMFWSWQTRRGKEQGSVSKMAMGCSILAASFLLLILATWGLDATARISFLWLVGVSLIYTFGELYLAPVGLSLVSKVAPPQMAGLLMGIWFVPMFAGNYLAGYLGMFYEKMSADMFFLMLSVIGVVAAMFIYILQAPLKKAVGHTV